MMHNGPRSPNQVPSALRAAAERIRNEPLEVVDALRLAVHPGTVHDAWHLPEGKVAVYEMAYIRVIDHYHGSINNADRDPDIADVLDALAAKSEVEGEGRRR